MDRPHDHYDGIGTLFFIPCNFTSNSLQRIASLKGTFPLMNNLWLETKHLDQQSLHRLKNFQKKVNDNTKCFITFTYIYIYIYFFSGFFTVLPLPLIEHEKTRGKNCAAGIFRSMSFKHSLELLDFSLFEITHYP